MERWEENGAGADDLALRLLDWYLAAGVDVAVGDEPVRRFDAPARAPKPPSLATEPSAPQPPAPSAPARPSLGEVATRALEVAGTAVTVEALRQAVEAFEGCALKRTANRTVFADGNPNADLMLIGEAPGADEDRIGRPFVGVSGQLLDRMLATIGLDRTKVYISNVVYWRPPGNRKPTDSEVAVCRPFVHRLIALVRPKILVLVGGSAVAALMPGAAGITRLRGQWMTLDLPEAGMTVQTIAMYHPSFLLRSPERKRESWRDLLSIQQRLKKTSNDIIDGG